MITAILLFEDSLVNIVSITFTALVLAELFNVGFEVRVCAFVFVPVAIMLCTFSDLNAS